MFSVIGQWTDLEQAKEFAEDVSKEYPGLRLFLVDLPKLSEVISELPGVIKDD